MGARCTSSRITGPFELGQESPGILKGKRELIDQFQGYVNIVFEFGPDQRGLARLPRSGDGHDRKPGDCFP